MYVCHHPLCNLALFLDNISCLSLICFRLYQNCLGHNMIIFVENYIQSLPMYLHIFCCQLHFQCVTSTWFASKTAIWSPFLPLGKVYVCRNYMSNKYRLYSIKACQFYGKSWKSPPSVVVGWQATQKYSFEYIIKKMDFLFTTFLFGAWRLKKAMLYWPITVRFMGYHWHPMLFWPKF